MPKRIRAGSAPWTAAVAMFAVFCASQPCDAQSLPLTILHNDRTIAGLHPLLVKGRVLIAVGPARSTMPARLPNASPVNAAQALFSSMRAMLVYDADSHTASVMTARLYPAIETRSASGTVGLARFALTTETRTQAGVRTSSTTSSRPLLVSPRVVGGIVYVPLRAFAEAAGAYVAWDAARRAIVLRTLPPSAQELAAEAEARARIDAIGTNARRSLENAAQNLR